MIKKRGLLVAKVDPPIEGEKEWNDWYDSIHVADRLTISGFLSARRFAKIEGIPRQFTIRGEAKYLALYDVASVKVLKDEAYESLRRTEASRSSESFEAQIFTLPKFARGVYEEIPLGQTGYAVPSSRFVLVVGHEVPRHKHKEFNAWYNTEHLPALLEVPGFVSGRRFMLAEREIATVVRRGGSISKYLTVYDIEDPSAFETDTFAKAARSPWSDWVRSWYIRTMCMLYRRIYPKE